MPDVLATTAAAAGASILIAGVIAQVRTHGIRRRWTEIGMGLEERATGLASLAAIPVLFPSELETARATDTQLAVLVMRRFTVHPEQLGRQLATATRAHETGWRLDYDLFGVTIAVEDRDEAILAAARLGRAACGGDSCGDLRIGIAMCPDDASDMFDAVDVAMRRMRGFNVVDAVAGQLRQANSLRARAAS